MADSTMTGRPTGTQQGNGLAIAGFVCGLIGIFFAQPILGPLGIIFGAIGWNKANHGAKLKGLAVAGVVLGAIAVILFVVLIVAALNNGGSYSWHVG